MKRKWGRSQGKIELFTGICILFLLTVLLMVQMQVEMFIVTGSYVEDALAASNLASAVIDVREYGMSNMIKIGDPDRAFAVYQQVLMENLGLDASWENPNKTLISGKVEVLQYEVYNVEEQDITIYSYGSSGAEVQVIPEGSGNVYTPDGCLVESTSVYSKIQFPIKGVLGMELTVEKEKTVDVVSNMT